MKRTTTYICEMCKRAVSCDDGGREHRETWHGGAVDKVHLEAMREVDALTPEVPRLFRNEVRFA